MNNLAIQILQREGDWDAMKANIDMYKVFRKKAKSFYSKGNIIKRNAIQKAICDLKQALENLNDSSTQKPNAYDNNR